MQINLAGLDLIKRFEGLRLEAYQDVAGIWTVGYGHIKSVKAGMKITEKEAEDLLKDDLKDAEHAVQGLIKVPVNDNEFSACCSLVFNIGRTAFGKSTTLKLLNKGDQIAAADAIELWNKSTVGGKKVVIPGLVARRAAEKGLFLTPTLASMLTGAAAPAPAKGATAPAPQAQAPAKANGATAPKGKPATPVATPVKDTGPSTRDKPTAESSRTRRDNLGGSRTIQGAVTTTAAGVATAGTGASGHLSNTPKYVQQALDYYHAHSNDILILVGVIVVVASLWIIVARIDDWIKGYR
jgi:GH24 family phage-related lysozyme (muramidase)